MASLSWAYGGGQLMHARLAGRFGWPEEDLSTARTRFLTRRVLCQKTPPVQVGDSRGVRVALWLVVETLVRVTVNRSHPATTSNLGLRNMHRANAGKPRVEEQGETILGIPEPSFRGETGCHLSFVAALDWPSLGGRRGHHRFRRGWRFG